MPLLAAAVYCLAAGVATTADVASCPLCNFTSSDYVGFAYFNLTGTESLDYGRCDDSTKVCIFPNASCLSTASPRPNGMGSCCESVPEVQAQQNKTMNIFTYGSLAIFLFGFVLISILMVRSFYYQSTAPPSSLKRRNFRSDNSSSTRSLGRSSIEEEDVDAIGDLEDFGAVQYHFEVKFGAGPMGIKVGAIGSGKGNSRFREGYLYVLEVVEGSAAAHAVLNDGTVGVKVGDCVRYIGVQRAGRAGQGLLELDYIPCAGMASSGFVTAMQEARAGEGESTDGDVILGLCRAEEAQRSLRMMHKIAMLRTVDGMATEDSSAGFGHGSARGGAEGPGVSVKSSRGKACMGVTRGLFYVAMVVGTLLAGIIMSQSLQTTLSVPSRNVLLAASAFLTPVEEVFAFLEDTVVIRVNYAVSAKRYEELGTILRWGFAGGMLLGTLGALSITILAYSPSFGTLLNPAFARDVELYPNCTGSALLPDTATLVAESRAFWLLEVWEWPGQFALKPLYGFFFGLLDIIPLAIAGLLSDTFVLPFWFLGKSHFSNKLLCYGLAQFFGSYLGVFASFFYLLAPCQLAREGLLVMVLDLSVQLSLTVGVFVAASRGSALQYKVATAMSAMGIIGAPYVTVPAFFLRIFGSQLLARHLYGAFRVVAIGCLIMSVGLGVVSFGMVWSDPAPFAYFYGEPACVFAGTSDCAPLYEAIFSGDEAMTSTFRAFGIVVVIQCGFEILRFAVATCCDFEFMAKAGAASLLLVFAPAIAVTRSVYADSAGAYLIAMYLPHLVLALVFAARLCWNFHAMDNNIPGPWLAHAVDSDDSGSSRTNQPADVELAVNNAVTDDGGMSSSNTIYVAMTD